MKHHALLRCFALLASIAVLSSHSGCAPKSSTPLRVGINPWPYCEFLYLAQEKGFFRDDGVEVRLVEFDLLSDERRAYENGLLDVMFTTSIEVLLTRDSSKRSPQIVQVADYSDGADVILARPGITNGAGLRGARIGIETGAFGIYFVARALEKHGLDFKDVTLVPVDQLSMADAFYKGHIDAVATYPPHSIKFIQDTHFVPVFTSAEIPGELPDAISIESEVIQQRPDDVTKLLSAFHRAIAYAQQHPDDAYRIMAAREGITPQEFGRSLTSGITRVTASDQPALFQPGGSLSQGLEHADRILRKHGYLKGPDRRDQTLNASFVLAGAKP